MFSSYASNVERLIPFMSATCDTTNPTFNGLNPEITKYINETSKHNLAELNELAFPFDKNRHVDENSGYASQVVIPGPSFNATLTH